MISLITMIKCRWLEFRREPSAFYYVIFFPIISILSLGYIFNTPNLKPHLIGIDSQSVFNETLFELRQSQKFKTIDGHLDELNQAMNRGRINLIVRLTPTTVEYHFDPQNSESQFARLALDEFIQNKNGAKPAIAALDVPRNQNGQRYVDFLIPGLLAFSVISTSLFGTGQLIVSNRRDNLLKRYLVTPMRPMSYIVSHIFGRLAILVLELTVILVCGYLVFNFKIQGSMGLFLMMTILGAAAFTALALLAASRTSNSSAYAGIVNAIVMPMALLGGIWFSRSYFPGWLENLTSWLPFTAFVESLRSIALDGAGFKEVWRSAALMLLMTGCFSWGSAKLFKWY